MDKKPQKEVHLKLPKEAEQPPEMLNGFWIETTTERPQKVLDTLYMGRVWAMAKGLNGFGN